MKLVLLAITMTLGAQDPGRNMNCVEGSFVQERRIPALEHPLQLQGSFLVSANGVMEWRVSSPYRYSYSIAHDRVLETLPDGNTRESTATDMPWLQVMMRLFDAMLAGEDAALDEIFVREDSGDNSSQLVPRNASLAAVVRRVNLGYSLREGRRVPVSLFIELEGGDTTELRFPEIRQCMSEPVSQ